MRCYISHRWVSQHDSRLENALSLGKKPTWLHLPTEALPLESGCCCDRWWRAWRGWALEWGCQEPYNRAASSLWPTSPAQAQVLEHPRWRFQRFPGRSVCPVGSLKHLTSRNHVRLGSQLSNGNFSPHSPSFLIPFTPAIFTPHTFLTSFLMFYGSFSFPILT